MQPDLAGLAQLPATDGWLKCHGAGLVGPYLAGAMSNNGRNYGTPLITLGAFVLAAAVMLFGAPMELLLWAPPTVILL